MNKVEVEQTVHVIDHFIRHIFGNRYELYGVNDKKYVKFFNAIVPLIKEVFPDWIYIAGKHGTKIEELNEGCRQLLRACLIVYYGQDHDVLRAAFDAIEKLILRRDGSVH
jgi:hypothetical protein